MTKSIVLYGSTTGATKKVAEKIAGEMDAPIADVASCDAKTLEDYDLLFFGSSTWGMGELQDDWAAFLPAFEKISLKDKKVALFGTGDQVGFSDTFVEALAIIHDAAVKAGGHVVGSWPADGYDGTGKALRDGRFVGLPLDDENQPEATEKRLEGWLNQVREEL